MPAGNVFGRRAPAPLIWLLATLAVLWLGHGIQSSVHLNHDVSWIVHSAGWLLEGRQFGLDVIDPNPPLIWWLSMPAAMLVDLRILTEPAAIRFLIWTYFLLSAALLFLITERYQGEQKAAAAGWRVSVLLVGALAPAASFGQREYLSVLFVMPYLAAAALRVSGTPGMQRWVFAAAGVMAGIGVAFKPYLLAIPVIVEAYVFARCGWRQSFRTETIAIVATLLLYVALVLVLVPHYWTFTVPLMRSIYWAYDNPNVSVLADRYAIVGAPFLYGALVALVSRCWNPQLSVLLFAGLGYSVSYFIQMKGFVYHAFPVHLCAFVFLGTAAASGLRRVANQRDALARPLFFAICGGVLALTIPSVVHGYRTTLGWFVQYNIAWGDTGRFRNAVVDLVKLHAPSPGSHFYAFSTHLFPGFPTASYTAADWSGRSATQGILAAYARRDELKDESAMRRVDEAAALQRRMVVEDMTQRPPSIVFVERSPVRFGLNGLQFDDISFYSADSEFRSIWQQYVEQEPIGPLRVFIRKPPAQAAATELIRPDR